MYLGSGVVWFESISYIIELLGNLLSYKVNGCLKMLPRLRLLLTN